MMFKIFRTSRHFVKEGLLCLIKLYFGLTFFSALFSMTIRLKFFHLFNFIKWSPVGWAEKWQLFAYGAFYIQMGVAFYCTGVVICDSLYCRFIYNIHSAICHSAIIGIIVVFAIEWTISSPETPTAAIKSVSIPFFAMIAIVFQIYHRNSCFYEETFG